VGALERAGFQVERRAVEGGDELRSGIERVLAEYADARSQQAYGRWPDRNRPPASFQLPDPPNGATLGRRRSPALTAGVKRATLTLGLATHRIARDEHL